jgi:hypothetical protein
VVFLVFIDSPPRMINVHLHRLRGRDPYKHIVKPRILRDVELGLHCFES